MLAIIQIIVAIILIGLILIQERSTGLSATFGGNSTPYQTRRGLEKGIFIATIVSGALFALLALANLII